MRIFYPTNSAACATMRARPASRSAFRGTSSSLCTTVRPFRSANIAVRATGWSALYNQARRLRRQYRQLRQR